MYILYFNQLNEVKSEQEATHKVMFETENYCSVLARVKGTDVFNCVMWLHRNSVIQSAIRTVPSGEVAFYVSLTNKAFTLYSRRNSKKK